MPRGKQPEGSTADLPSNVEIEVAEITRPDDIDAMFGIEDEPDGSQPSPGGETNPAPAGVDGAAGAGGGEGSSSAPVSTSPGEGAAPAQTATQGEGTSSPPSAQPSTPAPGAPQPAVAPGAVDENALKLQSLETTVAALQAELARARAQPPQQGAPQQSAQPAPGGQGAEQAADLPRYALHLPQPVAEAIFGEDTTPERQMAGITHMMNSLATIVHHNVRQEMRQSFGALFGAARQQEYETAQASAMTTARQDYFQAFPQHNDARILPIIQAEAAGLTAQFPGVGWNDQMRNALGARVEAALAQLRGGVQPQANGGSPPAAPATMIPAGPRAVPEGSELAGGDLIFDTFS